MYKDNILLTKKRITFSNKSENKTETPDLLSVQKESFDTLIQKGSDPKQREEIGLEKVFKAAFPIDDYNKRATLNYVSNIGFSFSSKSYSHVHNSNTTYIED